ncbi:MAG: hypothetical protein R6W95_00025, partial [Desulfosarcina sp.]
HISTIAMPRISICPFFIALSLLERVHSISLALLQNQPSDAAPPPFLRLSRVNPSKMKKTCFALNLPILPHGWCQEPAASHDRL